MNGGYHLFEAALPCLRLGMSVLMVLHRQLAARMTNREAADSVDILLIPRASATEEHGISLARAPREGGCSSQMLWGSVGNSSAGDGSPQTTSPPTRATFAAAPIQDALRDSLP